jgi:hypothetical protein
MTRRTGISVMVAGDHAELHDEASSSPAPGIERESAWTVQCTFVQRVH